MHDMLVSKLLIVHRTLQCAITHVHACLTTTQDASGVYLATSDAAGHTAVCHRHVRTLVLDLDDLLVHSDWTRGRGWRTFKRPGAEDFLKQMAQLYEIVVYTHALPTYADPILDRLDPSRYIVYRLYRDSTLYQHGHHVRDLSKLNRDMSKVLFVTSDPKACKLHPNNAVLVSFHTCSWFLTWLPKVFRALQCSAGGYAQLWCS